MKQRIAALQAAVVFLLAAEGSEDAAKLIDAIATADNDTDPNSPSTITEEYSVESLTAIGESVAEPATVYNTSHEGAVENEGGPVVEPIATSEQVTEAMLDGFHHAEDIVTAA